MEEETDGNTVRRPKSDVDVVCGEESSVELPRIIFSRWFDSGAYARKEVQDFFWAMSHCQPWTAVSNRGLRVLACLAGAGLLVSVSVHSRSKIMTSTHPMPYEQAPASFNVVDVISPSTFGLSIHSIVVRFESERF